MYAREAGMKILSRIERLLLAGTDESNATEIATFVQSLRHVVSFLWATSK
jgi:hypothetical protein